MSSLVLVVDDDPASIRLLRLILERDQQYEVMVAANAPAGLKMIVDVRPDVVIIDDMMPSMTGGEMCRQIKNDPALQDIPVILISAGSRVQDSSYIRKIGANYALVKPIMPKDVTTALNSVLGKSSQLER